MILDLEDKTVIFEGYTKLSLGQLWSLIELMDDDVDDDEDLLGRLAHKHKGDGAFPELHPEHGRVDLKVNKIYTVESDTRRNLYCVVHFTNGNWACSCPDWTNRRYQEDTYCKHISRLMHPRGWLV